MDMIEPKILTHADILENNLAEDSDPVWDPAIAYTVATAGSEVTSVRIPWEADQTTPVMPVKRYELIKDSAAGHYPPDHPSEWMDQGATNRWRMFNGDLELPAVADGTESTDPGKIAVKIRSGKMDAVGLFGLVATGVKFELYDSSDLLLESQTYDLMDSSNIFSWSTFFYEDRYYRRDLLHDFDLYHVSSLKFILEDTRQDSFPQLGYCLIGKRRYLGQTRYGLRTTALDFGQTFAKLLEADAHVDADKLDYVQGLLSRLYDIPIILQANNPGIDFESFLVLGKYKSFDLAYANDRRIPLNIQMQGLTQQKR